MVITPQKPIKDITPSEAVVQVVASHADVDPMDLPSLYGVIEPDALDTVIETLETGTIEFEYAGYLVSVRSDGPVRVEATRRNDCNSIPTEDD